MKRWIAELVDAKSKIGAIVAAGPVMIDLGFHRNELAIDGDGVHFVSDRNCSGSLMFPSSTKATGCCGSIVCCIELPNAALSTRIARTNQSYHLTTQ
jgi:hypothetical protein